MITNTCFHTSYHLYNIDLTRLLLGICTTQPSSQIFMSNENLELGHSAKRVDNVTKNVHSLSQFFLNHEFNTNNKEILHLCSKIKIEVPNTISV